jgi:hypothetical protein
MTGHIIDIGTLPEFYPTIHISSEFWEALGRTVATFGFLEEVLGKAIFAFTATRLYDDEAVLVAEFETWNKVLERALADQLGGLIDAYQKAASEHHKKVPADFLSTLVDSLREAAKLRNVLCHGSWRMPDEAGRSVPFFVTKKMEMFETPIDIAFLTTTQRAVAELSCDVINTVTSLGLQFPGSAGPGKPIAK